jgi:Protein of unknown function (DUF1826)
MEPEAMYRHDGNTALTPALQPVPEDPPPSLARSGKLLDLTAIFAPQIRLAILGRAPDPGISAYLDALAARGALRLGLRCVQEAGTAPELKHWAPEPGRQALEEDIAFISGVYGELLGCARIGLRLEVLGTAMCPRFHVDYTGIRLLCTYRGGGTEWLDERCADRRWLGAAAQGQADEDSGLIRSAQGIHRIEPFALALLKGEAWQDNAGQGLIHRSPLVLAAAAPRVVLALDAIW